MGEQVEETNQTSNFMTAKNTHSIANATCGTGLFCDKMRANHLPCYFLSLSWTKK
jgi:hypothetical protein